jgi:hypothetical protein
MMSGYQDSPVVVWHHRIIGSLWALGGLWYLPNVLLFWQGGGIAWLSMLVGCVCFSTGIGFVLGRTWARIAMVVLCMVAVLVSADMILAAGWLGNRALLEGALPALGASAYIVLFVLISAISRWKLAHTK